MKQKYIAFLSENYHIIPINVRIQMRDCIGNGEVVSIQNAGDTLVDAIDRSIEWGMLHECGSDFIEDLTNKLDWYDLMNEYGHINVLID